MMLEVFEDWLEYAREREKGAARVDPTIHSHCFGRPAGMAVFERIMELEKKSEDIWIGTRSEAAEHLRESVQ